MTLNHSSVLLDDQVAEIQLAYSPRIPHRKRFRILHAYDALAVFRFVWNMQKIEMQETFYMILMDRHNQLLGVVKLSEGGIAGTVVDMHFLFGTALKSMASSIILAHNHPSGNHNPSNHDRKLQQNIEEASKLFGIRFYDHFIMTTNHCYSMAHECIISTDFSEFPKAYRCK